MNSKLDRFITLINVTGDYHLSCRWYNALSKYNKRMGYFHDSSFVAVTQLLAKGYVTLGDVRSLGQGLVHPAHKIVGSTSGNDTIIPNVLDMILDDLEVNYGR